MSGSHQKVVHSLGSANDVGTTLATNSLAATRAPLRYLTLRRWPDLCHRSLSGHQVDHPADRSLWLGLSPFEFSRFQESGRRPGIEIRRSSEQVQAQRPGTCGNSSRSDDRHSRPRQQKNQTSLIRLLRGIRRGSVRLPASCPAGDASIRPRTGGRQASMIAATGKGHTW
jgi:hypothetical protein